MCTNNSNPTIYDFCIKGTLCVSDAAVDLLCQTTCSQEDMRVKKLKTCVCGGVSCDLKKTTVIMKLPTNTAPPAGQYASIRQLINLMIGI